MEETLERVAAPERVDTLASTHAKNDQFNHQNLEITTLPHRKVPTTK